MKKIKTAMQMEKIWKSRAYKNTKVEYHCTECTLTFSINIHSKIPQFVVLCPRCKSISVKREGCVEI